MLRWFLGKTTVGVVFATWNGWETAFPDDLRQAAAAISVTVDFACSSVKTIAAVTGRTIEAGDCAVFAAGDLVGSMLEERPRSGRDWLEALVSTGVGKPGRTPGEPPAIALVRLVRGALSQAATLPRFAKADPYDILGVPEGASLREVRRARTLRLAEYHPDRVAHLGARLRELADTQTLLINWAFEQIRQSSGERAPAPGNKAHTAPPRAAAATPISDATALILRKRRRVRRARSPGGAAQRQLGFNLA